LILVKLRIAAAVVLSAALLAAAVCGIYRPALEVSSGRRVRVAAAADLRFALSDVSRRFEQRHKIAVIASYGSSGTLYAQLTNEAPFDMFLSADIEYPRRLAARGLTLPDSEFAYAVGRLVVWVPASSALDPGRKGVAIAADPAVAHVAIANPAHAPYGRAAVEAMQAAGIYDAAKSKLVFGENVEQALQFAQTGAADAAIVALSLAVAPTVRASGRYVDVPPDSYTRIVQGGAILRASADVEAARAFRAFLIGAEGRAVLEAYGFVLPEN
jgi:molybdate transport system substrate-binding protein